MDTNIIAQQIALIQHLSKQDSTSIQQPSLKPTLPPQMNNKPYFLEVAHGQLAKNGDKVIDTRSKMEGVLNFGLWYWSVTWQDEMETIVADPSILKLK